MPSKVIKRYKKGSGSSYSLGVFPTLELLKSHADAVEVIYISSKSDLGWGFQSIKTLCAKDNIPLETNEKVFNMLSPKENVYAVGIFKTYDSCINKNENTIVLVNPSTAGNVGTIIRTMLGFEVLNLAIISPGVDIFNPEVIRSSMGALFKINFGYYESFEKFLEEGSPNVYLFTLDGEEINQRTKFKKPFSLVFGNEGRGLKNTELLQGRKMKIPMSKEIDSYNLAISAGIAIYQATSR